LRWAGVGLFSTVACLAQAQGPAAQEPTFSQGAKIATVPYSPPMDFAHPGLPHLRMSINGGPPQSFTVDTGSIGIWVGSASIPNFNGEGTPGEITYSSSGARDKGVWTMVEISFPDAKLPDGRPVIAHVPVLAVTSKECTGKGVNAAHCKSSSAPNPHMLGI